MPTSKGLMIIMMSCLPFREDEKEAEAPGNEEGAELRAGPEVEEVPRINVEIPRCVAQLGSDLYFAKLPNFLSVETR